MTASHSHYLQTKHFIGLDGLRCLAILPVIAHHATPRPPSGIWGKGAVGVDLFFVLSGFLITTLLLRERRTQGSIQLRRFYWRRSLRIFPLYYAVLALYVGLALLQAPDNPERAHLLENLIYHATYTANWFVDYQVNHPVPFSFSWSLCVEEQFYLLWPCLLAVIPNRTLTFAFMGGWVALDLWLGPRALGLEASGAAWRVISSFSAAIGCGALLAWGLDSSRSFAALSKVLAFRAAAPAALAATVLVLTVPATPYPWLCVCLAALVGAVALRADHGLAAVLNHPLAIWGGRLSYAAYLTHITALSVVRLGFPRLAGSFWFVFLLGLPLVVGLSLIAHFAIERPCLRLRDSRA